MPLVAGVGSVVDPGPVLGGVPVMAADWYSPDGTVWDLLGNAPSAPLWTRPGVSGIGAAPRTVTSRALATGGTVGRWSHADERLIAWPLGLDVGVGFLGHDDLWRMFLRSWTATSPAAGVPRYGLLRITRPDGTWRQLSCRYQSGLEFQGGPDLPGQGSPVLSIVASDPWWYGPSQSALHFGFTAPRSYFDPYETVSPTQTVGAQLITVDGDVDASPVWTLTGPALGYTVSIPGRSFTYNAPLAAGEQVTVDVGARTVTAAATGASRIGSLTLPGSQLFTLPAGRVLATVDIAGAQPGAAVDLSYAPRFESA